MNSDEDMIEFFKSQGYDEINNIDGFGWCAVNRFLFTFGVLNNMSISSVGGRWCFDTKANAMIFYNDLIKNGLNTEMPLIGEDGCTAIK
jgi:hypothetical protein